MVEVMTSADQVLAHESAWTARARKQRRVVVRVERDQRRGSFERRVGARAVSDGDEVSMNV